MTRKRWFWVGVIVLAVLLVPALVLSQRRPARAPESVPPAPAAEGNDLQPADQEQEAGRAESWLYLAAETPAAVTVVDGTTGDVAQTLAQAVLAPDASRLYEVRQAGGQTLVRALDPGSGYLAGEIALDGSYNLAWTGSLPGGLAPGGRWLVLEQMLWGEGYNRRQPAGRFAVLDLGLDAPPRVVDVEGRFQFDALSDDGSRLYLTEYLDEKAPYDDYRVRLYDLALGRLDPAIIADKRNGEAEMAGYRQAAVTSPDGRWLYSLYLRPQSGLPFVHALNLPEGYAFCIDLPDVRPHRAVEPSLWGLALSPDGGTLYVVNGTAGIAHEIDTAGPAVRRSVELDVPRAGAGGLARLLGLLAPVARAKMSVVNPVVLAPGGGTLYALAATGLLAVDTADLQVRGRYLADYKLNSLAVSPDDAALYALSFEPSRVLRLSPETGEIVASLEGKGFWSGILAVAGAAPLDWTGARGAVPAACRVTRQPEPPFLPPPPYDALAGEQGSFWYGGPDLWTMLPRSGTWGALPRGPGGLAQKTFWWKPGYDPMVEPEADVTVTGRRLDGPAPALAASPATHGTVGDLGSFMLAGVEVPEPGCWEITGRAGGQELTYVVWVAP